MALSLAACDSGGGAGGPAEPGDKDFPINQALAAEWVAKGIPPDIADFFAAAKMDTGRPDANTFVYRQTFPNGATRDVTLKLTPGLSYAPTPEESLKVAASGPALYDFKYANDTLDEGTFKLELAYFVPAADLPPELAALHAAAGSAADAARVGPGAAAAGKRGVRAGGEGDGAGVAWVETAKSGADVGVGSLVEYAKVKGLPVGGLANIYAIASAASAIGGALELAQQNNRWQLELAALEKCARNPTNPVTKSDPDYTPDAVRKIDQARSELAEVNSFRFLNQMNEAGSGATPQSAALFVALKSGSVWSDRTLGDYSENTIMREVREMVVPCGDPPVKLDGNVDVLWICNSPESPGVTKTTTHIVSSVGWVWNAAFRQYHSQGSFKYESIEVAEGSGGYTNIITAEGSLDQSGALQVYTDADYIKFAGYDYLATGELVAEATITTDKGVTQGPISVSWLPDIRGMSGAGGEISGEMTNPSCTGGGSGGTEVTKWSFTIPPME